MNSRPIIIIIYIFSLMLSNIKHPIKIVCCFVYQIFYHMCIYQSFNFNLKSPINIVQILKLNVRCQNLINTSSLPRNKLGFTSFKAQRNRSGRKDQEKCRTRYDVSYVVKSVLSNRILQRSPYFRTTFVTSSFPRLTPNKERNAVPTPKCG